MKKTFVNIVILLVANVAIALLGQFLYSILMDVKDDAVSVFGGLIDILFFTAVIYFSVIWCAISFIPLLIGFLLCKKDGTKVKTFIGFTTATLVMVCIYDLYWAYLVITLVIHILSAWYTLIPVVISIAMLIWTMVKTYSGYKSLSTMTYVAHNGYPVNNYPANQNNYEYNNMNYNQPYTSNINGSEYQTGQQYINPNNNYYG